MNKNFVVGAEIVGTTAALAVGIWTTFGPSRLSEPNWCLHNAIFDVCRTDAITIVAPNGQAAVIDGGHGSTAAGQIADFLSDEQENGLDEIEVVKLGFVTHYYQDHMGGIALLINSGIEFSSVYDQGPSLERSGATRYTEYLLAVGDLNDNTLDDDELDDNMFVRKRARVGLHWKPGDAKVRCVAVRGDTKGNTHDVPDCDPSIPGVDDEIGRNYLIWGVCNCRETDNN